MRRHTAYLRPETVAFSLASDAVSDEDKTTMAAASRGKNESDDDNATLVIDSGTSLADLVDGSSQLAFSLVGMDASLRMRMAASEWTMDADFLQYRDFVRPVKVTNDVA